MNEQLKPCPFCNGVVVTDKHVLDRERRGWEAHCNNDLTVCKIRPYTQLYDTEAEAIEAWNKANWRQAKFTELKNVADELALSVWSNICPKPVLDLAEKLAEVLNKLEGV